MKKKSILGTITILLSGTCLWAQTTTKTVITPRKTVSKSTTLVKKKTGKAADIARGKALIASSDCLSCHKLEVKLVGPAYVDVAKKYPATPENYDLLTKKVIEGGSGNWGPVAMSPHPTLAPADAKKMVTYILSLK